MLNNIRKEIINKADSKKAAILARFFKTGKGEYGEGDIFFGITVPEQRKIAKKYKNLFLKDIQQLLESKIHEERLISLLLLIDKYNSGNEKQKKKIYDFYLRNTKKINNWDLVDLSAEKIIGHHLYIENLGISRLIILSKSSNMWERRISILSTFYFIKNNSFEETINLAERLLQDKEDLIQKAVGWMLREVGKRDKKELENFLRKNYKNMPRTMLRYSIEKFPTSKRKLYLKGKA